MILPMLTYTHESVAMGNSHPLLLHQVSYITTAVDKHGISTCFKTFSYYIKKERGETFFLLFIDEFDI